MAEKECLAEPDGETTPFAAGDVYSGLTITGGAVVQEADGQIRLMESTNYTISGRWSGIFSGTSKSCYHSAGRRDGSGDI